MPIGQNSKGEWVNPPKELKMPRGFSQRELATIKATVAKDTNDLEFDLFMAYCQRKGLDPFAKEAIAVVFHKNDTTGKRQMQIITTQAGLRSSALDNPTYGAERTKPEYEIDPALIGPTNPLGIVSCTVTLWKKDIQANEWYPVVGVAYWDEFVPIVKQGEAGFEWEKTDEVYPEGHAKAGKQKYRKKLLGEIAETVDDSGQWKKMPRNQIAKCARMQALRAGWKEYSGIYSEEEFHRAIAEDKSASELVEQDRHDQRMKMIGASGEEYWFSDLAGNIKAIAAGKYGDAIIATARDCKDIESFNALRARNDDASKRFWANYKDDALAVRKELEQIESSLKSKPQEPK